MDTEKSAFARRLKAALKEAGVEASGARIEQLFATHYPNQPITSQAVNSWLRGKHMPTIDKLPALAKILDTDPCSLAFGGERVGEARSPWKVPAADRATIEAFIALSASDRKLVRELVARLSQQDAPQ